MKWTTCQETGCSAPTEAVGEPFHMHGFGQWPIRVWYERVQCAAGHRYMVEIFEEETDAVRRDDELHP